MIIYFLLMNQFILISKKQFDVYYNATIWAATYFLRFTIDWLVDVRAMGYTRYMSLHVLQFRE